MGKDQKLLKEKKPSLMDRLAKKLPPMSLERYRFSVVLYIVFIALMSILRVITIEKSIEFPGFTGENSNYKLEDTVYTKLFLILFVLGGVVSFLIGLFAYEIKYSRSKRSNVFVFVSSLAGFCMVGCAGFFIYRSTLVDIQMTRVGYISIILMLITGAYFAMDAIGFVGETSRPIFSMIAIGFGIARLMYEFIRLHDFQYYSSNEYHLISLIALLIFFCNDAKHVVYGKVGVIYKSIGLFASLSLLIYSLPEIYLSLFEPYYVDSNFIFCIVDVSLAFYVLAKLFSARRVLTENSGEVNV